ncbi:hypothetical protein ACT17_32970 [Mycolicibacterium conceptionense]|uniref:Uncharacterized protein n=1 Tax=Mycolicibacterium conceptionense TaxID=451644 RepID=A0A0J8TWV2_9MYCO|nr:hypothetical protein [Mycolicibacterium conceptionense]KMV13873.1 hypothetical protein ACT17_32970 [Mycolicibacterium conceptionense]
MTAVVEGSAVVVSRSVAELLGCGVQPGAAVWADTVDNGPVPGWLVVERVVVGRERRCAIVQAEACAVVSAGPISEVQVASGPIPTDELMPEWVSALASSHWDAQDARAERDAARSALQAHEDRLERIEDASHEFADEHSLCSDFDAFMISQGLRPRMSDWDNTVSATVRVRVPVRARNAEDAESQVDESLVVDALMELASRRSALSDALLDHDVVDTERA